MLNIYGAQPFNKALQKGVIWAQMAAEPSVRNPALGGQSMKPVGAGNSSNFRTPYPKKVSF